MAQQVDPTALVAQIQAIREQANRVQAFIAQLASMRDNVVKSKEALEALRKGVDSFIAYLDPGLNVAINVSNSSGGTVFFNIGFNIYAKVDIDKALEILAERERILSRNIGEANKQLNELVNLHNQYQALLQSIIEQQRREQRK
jgi:prefoldin alpha subunit